MSVDPAKFILIADWCPQLADYPQFCANTTQKLLDLDKAKPIKKIDDLVEVVASEISLHHSGPQHRLNISDTSTGQFADEQQYYGMLRRDDGSGLLGGLTSITTQTTTLRNFLKREFGDHNYNQSFTRSIGHSTRIKRPGPHGTTFRNVPLTVISNMKSGDDGKLTHTPDTIYLYHTDSNNRKVVDALWRDINKMFQAALDPSERRDTRIEKALECYWLLSHFCPFIRRSATLARITLAFLEEKVGFDLPPARQGIDFNVEALTRDAESFVRAVQNNDIVDPELSSLDVLEWHRHASAKQPDITQFEQSGYPRQYAIQFLEDTPLFKDHPPGDHTGKPRRPHSFVSRLATQSAPQHLGHGV